MHLPLQQEGKPEEMQFDIFRRLKLSRLAAGCLRNGAAVLGGEAAALVFYLPPPAEFNHIPATPSLIVMVPVPLSVPITGERTI